MVIFSDRSGKGERTFLRHWLRRIALVVSCLLLGDLAFCDKACSRAAIR